MNTHEIASGLSDVDSFIGAFPSNHIPQVLDRPAAYVINTAPAPDEYGGDHWVAIILKDNSHGEYFDSFGMPPIEHNIAFFITRMCPNGYKFSNKMIQSRSSAMCGLYCIDYIRQRLVQGVSFKTYLSSFNTDYKANDDSVVNRQSWLLSAQRLSLD